MIDTTPAPAPAVRTPWEPAPVRGRARLILTQLVLWSIVATLLTAAGLAGVSLRDKLYESSAPVRFKWDITNGYNRGSKVVADARALAGPDGKADQPVPWEFFLRAWVRGYDQTVEDRPGGNYELDYPPLRLLVMSTWAKHVRETFNDADEWRDEFTPPILKFNTFLEGIAGLGVFVLVWVWKSKTLAPTRFKTTYRLNLKTATSATVAALLFWFNPALLLDAHAWPQWDAWLLPFFVWSMVCVVTGRWWLAGVFLGLGAMFKGQMLLVAPVLPIFALFWGKPLSAGKLLLGFACAWGAVAWPWLVRGDGATILVIASTLVSSIVGFGAFLKWRGKWAGRNAFYLVPLIFVGSLSTAAVWMGGSFSWWSVGFAYGTRHYMKLMSGPTGNLPALLSKYNWNINDIVTRVTFPWSDQPTDLTLRTLLVTLFVLTLLVCAAGAALHARRRDPRMLLALVTPWVTLHAFLPQMHERYLLWGATLTCVAAGVSVGWTLVHVVVSLLGASYIGLVMLNMNGSFAAALQEFLRGTDPGFGWVLILVSLMLMYASVAPGTSRDPVRVSLK